MKKQLLIALLALLVTPVWAGSPECEFIRASIDAPRYYCDCHEKSTTFQFPLVLEVTDTVWYTATVNELKQGLSAYWFSDCSITIEVYAFCTGKTPSFSMTVGPNQMRDMDVSKINKKLDEMDEAARAHAEQLTPHVRVYPNGGGTGRVYCYPYDQGPESLCDDPLPLRPRMTYVCDKTENTYKLDHTQMPVSGKSFIHWKQKKNQPCEIWLTLDSCTGEEIGRASLSDSLHVYLPDSLKMKNAKAEKRSVWLHVIHEQGITGRVYLYNKPIITEGTPITGSTCEGKTLSANLRTYRRDTSFVDMLWVAADTLQMVNTQFTFTQPIITYDTVTVKSVGTGYRYRPGLVFYEYGDTIVDIVKANTCTQRIQLTIVEPEPDPNPPTSIDALPATKRAYKVLDNGQICILIDNKKLNVLGQQINNKQ